MDAKSALMRNSQSNILLADSSKFGKIFPTAYAHLKDFNIIISDKDLSSEWHEIIASCGITLYTV